MIENGVVTGYTGTPTYVAIPEGVTGIADSVFHNCFSLTGVTLPDSVTTIGHDVFTNCSGLTIHCSRSAAVVIDYANRNHIPVTLID